MVRISLVPVLTPLYPYVSTFRSMFIIIIIVVVVVVVTLLLELLPFT